MRSFECLLLIVLVAASGCATTRALDGGPSVSGLTREQLIEIGNVLAQNGDLVRAEQYYATALQYAGRRSEALLPLLRLYVKDGQYRLAIEQAEDCLRREPANAPLRLLLGTLYAATGQLREAVSAYEHVLRLQPISPEAHFAIATALHDGQIDRARADEHFRAYLSQAPHGEHAEEARSLLLTELP